MENTVYDRIVGEVAALVDRGVVEEALEKKSPAVRSDMLQEALRSAFLSSTLCCYNQQPYFFDGRIYVPADRMNGWRMLDTLVYDVLRAVGVPDGNYGKVRGMSWTIQSALRGKVLVIDSALMAFANCVYDSDTGDVLGFSAENKVVTMAPYAFDAEEVPMIWHTFLDRVLPDKGMQRVLQEFLGSVFVDRKRSKIEHMLILHGSGANGKSVVFETVKGIVGEENVTNFGIGSLIGGGDRQKNLAAINGRRLNYCSEIRAKEFNADNSDVLKTLISGEEMEARKVMENPFMARDLPLLMANANRLPSLTDLSDAMQRRIIIIPFSEKILPSEQDPGLAEKLRRDYPGIFNWIMEGRRRFISNRCKIQVTDRIKEALEEYVAQNSTVLRFMMERKYAKHPDDPSEYPAKVLAADLYADYGEWALTAQIPAAETEKSTQFGNILREAGFRKTRTPSGIAYFIYGDLSKMKVRTMKEAGDVGRRKEPVKADLRVFTEYGKRWVRTREGIAKALNVGEHVIQELLAKGELNGCYRVENKTNIFRVSAVRKKVSQYLASRLRSESEKKEADALNARRARFNKRMKQIGEPYRKYDTRRAPYWTNTANGEILVPDDWDYGQEIPIEAQSMTIGRRKQIKEIENGID